MLHGNSCYYLKTIVLCIATIYTRNLMRNAYKFSCRQISFKTKKYKKS